MIDDADASVITNVLLVLEEINLEKGGLLFFFFVPPFPPTIICLLNQLM